MKLKGAKKAEFLRRMALGRAKKSRNSTKSATNNKKKNSTKSMQRTKKRSSRRSRVVGGFRRARAGTGRFSILQDLM